MIFHAFLIKYAEIAIKGKNRYIFEDALVKQMNIALSKVEGEFEVKKEQGRIYVFCPEQYDYDETVEALQHVFGIVGICPVVIYEDQGFEQMAKDVVSYMKNCHPNYDGSFKVYTRRAKKSYPITSMEVSAELGGRILDEFPDASVDVHEPDLTLSVEIRDKIYVYSQTASLHDAYCRAFRKRKQMSRSDHWRKHRSGCQPDPAEPCSNKRSLHTPCIPSGYRIRQTGNRRKILGNRNL